MNRRHRVLVGVGLALVTGLIAMALGRVPLIRGVEWMLYDLRMRQTIDPAQAPKTIAIVEIDEDSIRDLEPVVGRWPWPRAMHGRLIDYLARAPARLIVYDVLFLEHDRQQAITIGGTTLSGAESDQALVDATAAAGNVIVAAEASSAGQAEPGAASAGAGPAASTPAASAPPGQAPAGPTPAPSAPAAAAPAATAPDATAPATAPAAMGAAKPAYRLAEPLDEGVPVTPPFAELAAASLALGHNRMVLDDDGPVRRVVPFVRSGGEDVPSLGVAAFLAAQRVPPAQVRLDAAELMLGDRDVPLLRFAVPRFENETGAREARHSLVRFRGPAVLPDGKTTTYRVYSYGDLLLSEEQLLAGEAPRVDPAVFKETIVFVGVAAAGLHDVFMTPLGNTGKIPGTQVHAAVTDQLLAARAIRPVGLVPQVAAVFLCSLIVGLLTVVTPIRVGAVTTAVVATAIGGVGLWLFARGAWLSLIEPFVAIALAGTGGLAWQYFVEGREKRQVKQLFSRYLSKDVYEQVLENPALAELGGSRRTMSVLFSDVRGFTALSEKGEPEALVAQLNEYFSRMVEIVFAHRGTLDKFVGDMVMALFGAPLDDEDHAEHAVQTALAMVQGLNELNAKWRAEGRPALGIGIGVNTGEMIAGNIGAETVRSYTVIGDAVNLGARLESLNKDYHTQIIISAATAQGLNGRYNLRPLGQVVVKGKSVPVEIYEVLTASGVTPS